MTKVKITSYISPEHRHKLDTIYAYYLSKGERKTYGQLIEKSIEEQYNFVSRSLSLIS